MCEVYRIPHSHFLGGPLVWTQADRDKAIWHQVQKAETCPSCGTRPAEWDPDEGGHRHAYTAEVGRCPGCAVLEQQQEAFSSAMKGEYPRGSRVVLKRRREA